MRCWVAQSPHSSTIIWGRRSSSATASQGSFLNHAADPYTVVGILARTATPVDRAIYITLWGDEAMHLGWENGAPPLQPIPESQIHKSDLHIRTISAFLLRTKFAHRDAISATRDQHLQAGTTDGHHPRDDAPRSVERSEQRRTLLCRW